MSWGHKPKSLTAHKVPSNTMLVALACSAKTQCSLPWLCRDSGFAARPVTRCSLPARSVPAGGDRPPWLCRNSGYAALLAMPQFWLRRPRPVARCSLPKVCRLAELVPSGYASILAAPPSTRFPWLCLDSGCAALNSGCAATPLHKLRSPSELKSPLCRSSGCRYINSSLLPNSSLLLISSGYAVLAAPYSIVASNNLDVAPEYSRCCHLFFLGFPSPETKL